MTEAGLGEGLAALLREAGRAHHEAFRRVDGQDTDWALWYAEYLTPRLAIDGPTGLEPAAVAAALVGAEQARKRESPDADWPAYYARWISARWPWTVRAP